MHRLFLSGTRDSVVNTISWNSASFCNGRVWGSLPLTFVSSSKLPLSQQANICDQQTFRDYTERHSGCKWEENRTEFKEWCNFCLSDISSDEWWDVSVDKVLLFLEPLSKTLSRVKWEKSITLTDTLVVKVPILKCYRAYSFHGDTFSLYNGV